MKNYMTNYKNNLITKCREGKDVERFLLIEICSLLYQIAKGIGELNEK